MTKSQSEQRRFGMHANLLYDVITKQAGTLQKAILEGVMNGVDAGANRIEITLDADRLTIVDNGKGFTSREEIEQFFETFGTPHQEGDATYGRFRMGRGQLFAFGANTWRTNVFKMDVDIKGRGLDYDLTVVGEAAPGCAIDIALYRSLLPSELDAIVRELRGWVRYVDVPVVLNGKTISEDPAAATWDVQTDEAYFKLASSKDTLAVYNLGVLVNHLPASRFGTGGTVVSKKRLDVNFARNDVQSDCPVFRAIQKELRKHSDTKVAAKPKMTDSERQHLAERLVGHTLDYDTAAALKIITDIDGKHMSLEAFGRALAANPVIIAAPRGDRVAISIAGQQLAVAIAQETLERFGVDSLPDLLAAIAGAAQAWHAASLSDSRFYGHGDWRANNLKLLMERAKPESVDTFRHLIDSDYEGIPLAKLKKGERVCLNTLKAGNYTIAHALGINIRQLHAGHSDLAQAWTDGENHIWIDAKSLKLVREGYQGCARLAALLVHEYLHGEPDTETHVHDAEFYQRHHDLVIDTDVIGEAVARMMYYLASEARRRQNKPLSRVSIFEDNEAKVAKEGVSVGKPFDVEAFEASIARDEDAPDIAKAA